MVRLAVLFVALVAGTAHAQDDYRCVIERIEHLDASDAVKEMFRNTYVGQEFTVERRTGLMSGTLKNSSAYVEPQVIDSGSAENSYKVVSTVRVGQAGPGSGVTLLTVREFADGPRKPFLFVQSDVVFFGVCTHF